MKNVSKLMVEARIALALHPKCGAKCKQREGFCINPAMKNGRCYIHGGMSTGPKPKHGQSSKAAKEKRKQARQVIKTISQSETEFSNSTELGD
jgi:hypothetical protein